MKHNLNKYQIRKAFEWDDKHGDHVEELMKSLPEGSNFYPPSDIEDINNPNLWKGNHWVWLFRKYGVHRTHCCIFHGCKYGYNDCPVYTAVIPQEYVCENCHDDWGDGTKNIHDCHAKFKQEDRDNTMDSLI